jgi:tetratricopeptide (TPR) repeat protein
VTDLDVNALFAKALAAVSANQADEAQSLLMQVVRAQPDHEQAWLLLADLVPDIGRSIFCLRRVLELNPGNSTAQAWLAIVEHETDQASGGAGRKEAQGPPVPPLGDYLLEHGYITPAQLAAAVKAQDEALRAGRSRRLGDILLERQAITEEQLNQAVLEQHRDFSLLFWD